MPTNSQIYGAKLLDARWLKLRDEILERDNYTCLLCEDQTTQLHVHHDAYKGDPWQVPPILLRTVCMHCHEVLHTFPNEIKKIKKVFISANRYKVFAFANRGVRLILFNYSELTIGYSLTYEQVELIYNNKLI